MRNSIELVEYLRNSLKRVTPEADALWWAASEAVEVIASLNRRELAEMMVAGIPALDMSDVNSYVQSRREAMAFDLFDRIDLSTEEEWMLDEAMKGYIKQWFIGEDE